MSLTLGSGPLAGRPNGSINYAIESPAHRMLLQDHPLRLRAMIGDRVVLDSTRVKLLHETGQSIRPYAPLEEFETSLPLRLYVPAGDVAPGVLQPSETRSQCPYKGEARYLSLGVDGARLDDSAWIYDSPLPEAAKVAGHVAFEGEGIEVELSEPAA